MNLEGDKKMNEFLTFVADVMDTDVDEINMETTYKEYSKWDSLMMMTLVMELEEEYDVSISIDEIGKVHTLEDLYKLIEE